MSEHQARDPHLWEAGCLSDKVRNELIVPDLVKRIERLRPARIADVGSGTGYVPRAAAARLKGILCSWTLLEKDASMRQLASDKVAIDGRFEVIPFDVLKPEAVFVGAFDLVLCLFSTLDFGMSKEIAANLVGLLRPKASLLIYVPDMLEEVAQMCANSSSLDPLNAYRRGEAHIKKPDRFTDRIEPFVAHRVEFCISEVLGAGANLQHLDFLDRCDDRRIAALEFVRNG